MERIPFPDKLVKWKDIVKGIADVAFHSIFDRHRYEPKQYNFQDIVYHDATMPDGEWDEPLTDVQKDANAWVEKMGFEDD